MTYVELLEQFVKTNEGARLSTKILALEGFVASLGKNNITLTEDNITNLIHNLGIKNKKVYPLVQDVLAKFVAKSYRPEPEQVIAEEKEEKLDNERTEKFASAADTPDDMDYLSRLGVVDPERPWKR